MKRKKIILMSALLLVIVMMMGVVLTCCNNDDKEKQEAIITVSTSQRFAYDGQAHSIDATLNHTETELVYSPQKSYTDIGEYTITVSAAETKNYKAASVTVNLTIYDPEDLKSVNKRWSEFQTALASAYSIDGKKDIKFNIQANATLSPKGEEALQYKLDAMGNIDLTNAQDNTSLFHIVFNADDKRFGIYYQNNAAYLEIGEKILKINNSDLGMFLNQSGVASFAADDDDSKSTIDYILSLLPTLLFRNKADIVNKDNVWTLTIDSSNAWGKISSILSIVGNIVSEDNMEILNKFFTDNATTFELKFDLSSANLPKVSASAEIASYGKVNANISAMEVANGKYDSVTGSLDADKIASATEINLANAVISGSIQLIDKNGKDYEHLNWKLVTDIDPFALASAIKASQDGISWLQDSAVKKMKIHFSLYHEHRPGEGVACTDAMCPTRAGGMEDTTILDIAFDPQNFGDSRIYIAANLSRIFSAKSVEALLSNISTLAGVIKDIALPIKDQNFFTAIDLTKLIKESEEETPGEGDDDDSFKFDISMVNPIVDILTKGIILDGGITLDMNMTYNALNAIFDLNSLINISLGGVININADAIRNGIFKGLLSPDDATEMQQFNSLRLAISSMNLGAANGYNCKDAITHDPIDTTKERTYGNSKPLALQGANPTVTGKVFNTQQVETFSADTPQGIFIALEELDSFIGQNIEYTYTAMDGNTYTATTQIVDIIGLDKTNLSTAQNVKVVVLPLDGKGGLFSDGLWSIIKALHSNSLIGGFLPTNLALPLGVDVIDMTLTLTEFDGEVQFTIPNEPSASYAIKAKEFDESAKIDLANVMSGTVTVNYKNGKNRTMPASIEHNLEYNKPIFGKETYFLYNDGQEHKIRYYYSCAPEFYKEYDVTPKAPASAYLAQNGKGQLTLITDGATSGLQLEIVLKTSSKTIDSSQFKVFFGGTAVEDISLDTDGAKAVILAASSDEIEVAFDKALEKISGLNLYYTLKDSDGAVLADAEIKSKKSFAKIGQEAIWKSMTGLTTLGSQLDGQFTYTYWLDSDDKFADARVLTLVFQDGKYYMVDNVENPTVKCEVNLNVSDKDDKTNKNLLVNGILPDDAYYKLSYNATTKASKTPSVNITATFEVPGVANPVTETKSNQSLTTALKPNYTAGYLYAGKPLGNKITFEVMVSGKKHKMDLTFKNGAFVLSDTSTENALADIAVAITAIETTSKNPVALVDGNIPANCAANTKLTITAVFTYQGYELSYSTNATVKE